MSSGATANTAPMPSPHASSETAGLTQPAQHCTGLEGSLAKDGSPVRFTRGEPLALTLFRFLELRPVQDAEHVLGAIRATRGVGVDAAVIGLVRRSRPNVATTTDSARVTLSLQSLALARDALQRVPSRREYDRWHRAHPHRTELATSSFIRRTFDDSWVEAVAQAGAPVADITARRLLRNGKAFSEDQRDLALSLFLEAVPPGKRTQVAFERWARTYVQQPGAFDIPTSAQALLKGRGCNWHERLASAGAAEDKYRTIRTINHISRAARKSPDQMLDLLRLAAKEIGVPAPTTLEYQRWVEGHLDEFGNRLAPTCGTVMRQFGGWSIALRQAGLLTEEQFAIYWTRRGLRLSNDRQLEFVAAAARDLGYAPNRLAYRAWRWEILRHPQWPLHGCIPSDMSIVGRFKGWEHAVLQSKGVAPAPEIPDGMHASATAVWTKRGFKMDRGRS